MDASPKQNASDSPTFPHFSISFKTISIPKKVADRLQEYVRSEKIGLNSRIFPICYEAARAVVRKAGNMVGIYLRPHDLRRHAATFAKFQHIAKNTTSVIVSIFRRTLKNMNWYC